MSTATQKSTPAAPSTVANPSREAPRQPPSRGRALVQRLAAEGFAAQERALDPRSQLEGPPVQMVKKDGAPGPSPDRQVLTAAPGAAAKKEEGAEGASGDVDAGTTRGFGAKAVKAGQQQSAPPTSREVETAPRVKGRDKSGSVVKLGGAGRSQADGEESGGWGVRDGHLGYRPRAGYRPGGPVPAGGGSATVSASVAAENLASDAYTHARRFMAAAEEHPEASEDELLTEATLDAWGALGMVNKGAKTGFLGKHEAPSGVAVTKQALIIGNSNYAAEGWAKLSGASADADNMASLYRAPPRRYQVDRRADLGGGDLASAIGSAGADLIPGDELLIFYAGHGKAPKGDLVGVDGKEVPASVPAARAKEAQSRGFHATVILDSCHSGAVFDDFAIRGPAASKAPDAKDRSSTVLDPTTHKYAAFDPAKHTESRPLFGSAAKKPV